MSSTCHDVRLLIEAIVSGDRVPDATMAGHLAECPRCAADLALARQLDLVLASTSIPTVPAGFVANVLRRVRRDWWRSEQHLDLWFNVSVGGGLLLVLAGIWVLMNLSGLTAVALDASGLLVSGARAVSLRVTPTLPIYGTASIILLAAFGLWWWAERGWTG